MAFTTKNIAGKDFAGFLLKFNDNQTKFTLSKSGQMVLDGFTYTNTDAIDTFYMNPAQRFVVIIDESAHKLVSIVAYWTNLGSMYGEKYKNVSATLNYIEISKYYQHQHLLSYVCDEFAKSIKAKTFTSNSESDAGRLANVNYHLERSCNLANINFFSSDEDLIKILLRKHS